MHHAPFYIKAIDSASRSDTKIFNATICVNFCRYKICNIRLIGVIMNLKNNCYNLDHSHTEKIGCLYNQLLLGKICWEVYSHQHSIRFRWKSCGKLKYWKQFAETRLIKPPRFWSQVAYNFIKLNTAIHSRYQRYFSNFEQKMMIDCWYSRNFLIWVNIISTLKKNSTTLNWYQLPYFLF